MDKEEFKERKNVIGRKLVRVYDEFEELCDSFVRSNCELEHDDVVTIKCNSLCYLVDSCRADTTGLSTSNMHGSGVIVTCQSGDEFMLDDVTKIGHLDRGMGS